MPRVVGKRSGKTYDLHPKDVIGRGAEGTVFKAGQVCVKVFDAGLSDTEAHKIEVLARLLKGARSIAAPIELVIDTRTRKPVGFVQPFVPGQTLESYLDARATAGWDLDTKFRVGAAFTCGVASVHSLRSPRLVLGDGAKASNFIVTDSGGSFIDTNTLSVFGYRSADGSLMNSVSPLTTPGYVPPEVLNNPDATPSHAADLFALAVTLFELFHGRSPTEPKPTPAAFGLDPDEAVRRGLFVKYVTHPEFEPPTYDGTPIPDRIDNLFRTAFLGRPDQRPSARKWLRALKAWGRTNSTALKFLSRLPRISLTGHRRVELLATVVLAAASSVLVARWAAAEVRERLSRPAMQTAPEPLPAKPVGPPAFQEVFK